MDVDIRISGTNNPIPSLWKWTKCRRSPHLPGQTLEILILNGSPYEQGSRIERANVQTRMCQKIPPEGNLVKAKSCNQ